MPTADEPNKKLVPKSVANSRKQLSAEGTRSAKLKEWLATEAALLGFDRCRFASADLPAITGRRLEEMVQAGRHGTMTWLADTLERRISPTAMWPEAKTAIVLGMNYGPDHDPMAVLGKPDRAAISVYAQNRDYHDVVKGRLKTLAAKLVSRISADVKVFVDTAPLMEKPLAAIAGLGWQGKHTNLVSRELGSWLFLGIILTSADIAPDSPEIDHCGTCRACLDICPTRAFPRPYQLDARRCISYLTIEHKGSMPVHLRSLIGNRIYGCDDCLAACPWNKFAREATEMKLQARPELKEPELAILLTLDDQSFRQMFSGSPVKRIGRNRFIRNCLIAAGNSADKNLVNKVQVHLTDPDAVVRGAAIWALSQLLNVDEFDRLRLKFEHQESDPDVGLEWERFS